MYNWASLVAQMVKNLPAMWEIQVQFLGWGDPLEKEMATHSRFLPGKSHGWRSLVGYSPWGRTELDMTEQLNGDGNGTPLQYSFFFFLYFACFQYSCLENPMDGGAW